MATANVTFWAYNWYLMNNPHKTHLTRQDIHEMAVKFAAANSTEITTANDPGGTYTGIEWPDQAGASTITAIGNSSTDVHGVLRWDLVDPASQVTLDQAWYPEDHVGA